MYGAIWHFLGYPPGGGPGGGGGGEGAVRFPTDEPPVHIPRAEDRELELSGSRSP